MCTKKYNWVKRVCVIDSSYSLLIYLLISTIDEIDKTFFVWGNGIPQYIRDTYHHKSKYIINNNPNDKKWYPMSKKYFLWQMYFYYIGSYIEFPFLKCKGISYWGHDHLFYSPFFFHANQYNAIEDGMYNYTPEPERTNYSFIRKLFFGGPLIIRRKYRFQQETCAWEYLTGIDPNCPAVNSPKAKVKSLDRMWNEQSIEKRMYICNYFGLTEKEISEFKKYDSILLTQPFSEDGDLTEEEKIEMYRKQMTKEGIEKIIIKPHPREITDYSLYFPNNCIFKKKVPIELLNLVGVKFSKVYTVNSTAAFNLSDSAIIWGSEINEKLLDKYPLFTSKLLKEKNVFL